MKRLTLILAAVFVGITSAQVKNVAVVETDIDAQSGASAKLTRAEVRQITAELRKEAVNNLLPQDKYNIMTSETVIAQGGAVLEECAEENCVIKLGSTIGADYIVRGTISKFQTKLTLSVEMYETENGNLVASSGLIASEKPAELLEMTKKACAETYKTFAAAQNAIQKSRVNYTITATVNPPNGGSVTRNPDRTYYTVGTNVNLMAAPANGYEFTRWTGDTTGTENLLTLKMDGNKILTANFQYTQRTYTLTTNVYPSGGGQITNDPYKETYTAGEEVSITATPSEGYAFTGWTGIATAGRTNRVTAMMYRDMTLTANFYKQSTAPVPETNAAQLNRKKHTGTAVSLDLLGAGILIYGCARDASATKNIDKGLYTTATKQVKQRNTAYILGSIILLSGITVHIFF
jgi:uncharacterized repeat protein (TIGR02543 family)